MTVGELIAALERMPRGCIVFVTPPDDIWPDGLTPCAVIMHDDISDPESAVFIETFDEFDE